MSTPRFGSEFDLFLYASVGDDHNGMPLTVLSALARMDVDPWDEALKLAQLPQDSAVTQLASLLGALRNMPGSGVDAARIAAALIALLPRAGGRAPPVLKAFALAAPRKHRAAVSTALTILTYVMFVLLTQWFWGRLERPRHSPSPPSATTALDPPGEPVE